MSGTAAPTPQRRLIQGSLWKMKTSMTGGIKWKKKWVSSDGIVVAHWHSDVLPKKSTPPKHTYVLEKCLVIEFKATRPYAFKIKDKRSKEEIVFACDNITEYAQWLSFLTDDKSIPVGSSPAEHEEAGPEQPRGRSRSPEKPRRDPMQRADDYDDEDLSETISGYNEMEATTEDKINDFFHNQNCRLDKEVSIRATEFWDLMKSLDERISISMGRQALALLTKKPGIIFLRDFLAWWQTRHHSDSKSTNSETSNALRSHIGLSSTKQVVSSGSGQLSIFGANLPVNHLHYAGIVDGDLSMQSAAAEADGSADLLRSSVFLRQRLPSVKNILTEWAPRHGAGGTWNERLQSAMEAVLDAQNAIYGDSAGEVRQGPSALLESYFEYFAVKGEFLVAARAGAQLIVDEYSLPGHMRSAELLRLQDGGGEEDAQATAGAADVEAEEVFVLDGIVYRLVAVPASSRDLESNSSDVHLRYVAATDAIKHKIAGNSHRAHTAVQRALSMFAADRGGRPCCVVETLVDHGGYRVQAFCPVYLEERRTLKYGHASLEDIFICQDLPEPDSGQDYTYQKIFQQLAEKLNLRQRIVRTVVSDQPGTDDIDNVHVYESSELVLTKDIQFHQSDDERFYLVNFNNLMPPDVPAPESNDVLTKHFRPEFVAKFQLSLSPEALSIESGIAEEAEGNAEGVDGAAAEGATHHVSFGDARDAAADRDRKQSVIAQNVARMTVESVVLAAKKLRTAVIPDVAKRLDYMAVLPIDSYGITKFLHANGVNCRHLGLLYNCSSVFHVRQLLLCEAVARTVKALLRQVLQQCARRGKAESMVAEERGRSKESHFVDHQQSLLAAKRRAVVDMFNLVLGTGPKCDEFWTGLLPSAVLTKFGLAVPKSQDRCTVLHAFQLFEAAKYHCGASFKDSNQYLFHQSGVTEPFQLEDLIDYSPVVKVSHLYPGADHDLEALSAGYLKEKMFGDALNVLRIHMSAVVLSQGTQVVERFLSPKQRAIAAHLTYQIALCHFMLKQYDMCSNTLLAQLESTPKYSVMAARMLTLLMSSTFLSGSGSSKVATALQYFETGRMMYCLALGSQTPLHGLHASALADLYFTSGALPQAKVANMIAQSNYQHALGDMHPVCAGVACKLGNLLLAEKQYGAAVEMLEAAFAVYQHINRQVSQGKGDGKESTHVYYTDEAHCLHALAVALRGKSEVTYAMQCAVLSVDIATSENRPITPGIVHTLLILAEMYESTSDLFTAVALYQDVWSIVKMNPHVFPMSSMLVDLAGRMVRVVVDMLPLQSRTLIDTIVAEAEPPSPTEWDVAVNMLVVELWAQEPVPYIRDTVKQALEEAGETGMFSLATRLDNIVRSKASTGIIGVPFCVMEDAPAELRPQRAASVPKPQPPTVATEARASSPAGAQLKRASSEFDYAQRKTNFLARTSSAPINSGEGLMSPIAEGGEEEHNGRAKSGSVSFQHPSEGPAELQESSEPEDEGNAGLELTLNLKLRALLKLSMQDRKNK